MNKIHPFHMVQMSPWPLTAALSAFALVISFISWIQLNSSMIFYASFIMISLAAFNWWRDVFRETNFEGLHPLNVMKGLKIGMIFFISSEIMFFFSFFWSFFQSSISPNIELGETWPPSMIQPFDPMNIPLLNTLLLISSGVSITWSHHLLLENQLKPALQTLFLTITLGILFSFLQGFEYSQAPFNFSNSTYGSTFFISTGFHGLHVLIGSTFLLVCFISMMNKTLSFNHTIGFETAAWYWHFVDVVWLFLYTFIYWWSI